MNKVPKQPQKRNAKSQNDYIKKTKEFSQTCFYDSIYILLTFTRTMQVLRAQFGQSGRNKEFQIPWTPPLDVRLLNILG